MTGRNLEDRTEEPTPRRLAQARRAGEVALSRDLASGFAVFAFCLVAVAGGKAWLGGLLAYLHTALAKASGPCTVSASLAAALHAAAFALALPLGSLLVVAVLINLVQTRGNVALAQARPEGRRLVPSLRRVLGRHGVSEAGKGWAKLIVLLAVACVTIRPWVGSIVASAGVDSRQVLRIVGALAQTLGIRLALALLVLGAADYLWQLHRHRKALRMTREEVRREHKETEGDPLHKAEQKRLHRELHDL